MPATETGYLLEVGPGAFGVLTSNVSASLSNASKLIVDSGRGELMVRL